MFSYSEQMDETGRMIREHRTRRGISLRELAQRISVSPATMSAIETGTTGVTVARLHAIAAALDSSSADLLPTARGDAPVIAPTTAPRPSAVGASTTGAPQGGQLAWRDFPPLAIDAILAAAINCFVETGYHGATMRSIAQRAGMSVAGVYHHYRSKQELLVAVLDLTMSELTERTALARNEGKTASERVALIVECLALFHLHRRELAFIGASEMRSFEPSNRQRIADLRNQLQHLLDREILQGIEDGELTTSSPIVAGRAISTMCTSLPQWFRATGPATAEEIAADYAQFAMGLLGYLPPTPDMQSGTV